ncbi:MAG: ATP-binding protein, partial [Thermomicrobium sp.]|nr:ATP-binding protein [Thermomicrobium sp.]
MRTLAARLRARLSGRPDTEHEQAIVRLVVGGVLFFYLLPQAFERSGPAWAANYQYLLAMVAYLVLAAVIFVDILARPGISRSRRVLAAVADIGAVTYFMAQTGAHGAPLFLVYLWITLANGFRFGRRYLLVSLALSAAGFVLVLAASPFWREHLDMGVGLLIGFVAISVYVLSLVNRMFDAIARAEAANHAKRRFISMVSHEMRTPLNAVIGMSDLLQAGTLDREQSEMVRTIGSSSRVLLGLVEDVLDFSKIEAGKLTISVTDFDLHALVNSVARIFALQASEKNLDFHVVMMPEVPHALRGDPHYIRQVVINLTSNALKFTEAGSVTVHVAKVAESAERVTLKFSVRDTGIGIAPENQARIFESFTQADDSTTRRFGGTGLGTTISKQLVELMGGRIGVESAVGLGSTFWFEIELEKQTESAVAVEQGAQVIAGSRVLIIGSEESARAIGALLEGWGTGWVSAPGPDTAATVMAVEAKRGLPFRMVLVHAESLRQGQAVLGRVRRSPDVAGIPAILVVPRGAAGAQGPASSHDFSAVLEAPVDKRLLFNALHAIAADEPQQGVVALRDYLKRKDVLPSYRILLVDDHATNRAVVGRILERSGHTVVSVSSGDEALDAAEEQRFDLVILDRNCLLYTS